MRNPLISFIITYYNIPSGMLEECVESLIGIDLSDAERQVVLVDDGSDVDMESRLKTICPNILYIRQKNAGPGAARNTGIENATGSYIQFVDGDDTLLPEAYNYCVRKLRQERPDAVIFGSSHKRVTFGGTGFAWHKLTSGADYMCNNNMHASPCEYVFKREMLAELRFPEGIFHEDEEFSPQLIVKAQTLWHTDAVAYFYRVRPNSTMNNHTVEFIRKRLDYMPGILHRLSVAASVMSGKPRKGMERKVAQLTMDYIFNLIRLQRNRLRVAEGIASLCSMGLYPLPRRHYTRTYTLFAVLANNRCGLALLYALLPLVRHNDY